MPNTSEGFDQVEASASPEHAVNVVKFESVQSDPAPRRRRGGRRVVRGVGAAGASLELKVEEHASAPLFEEPKLPVAQPAHDTGDSADSEGMTRPTRRRRRPVQSDDDVREIADERPTRSRRRRSVQVEDEQDEDRPSRRRSRFADDADEYDEMPRRRASVDDSHDEESSVERALDAVDMLPEGHEVRDNPRPMMSLLFQEPVLPSVADSRDRADDDRDDSRNDRGERNDRNAQDHEDEQDEDRPSRRRRRRNRDVADEERSEDNRNERDNRDNRNDDADNDEEGGSRKSRRSRRLNAQERRAAAEVEQIEEDLILDDITYAPIDDETRNRHDDDDDEQPTRTRRRRRSRGNREEADEQQRDSDEGERMGTFSQYAVAAAKEAFADAGISMENEDPFRVGVLVGSGVGDLNACEQAKAKIDAGNPSRVNPFTVPVMIANMAAGNVAIALGAKGKCTSVVTACATGTHCIGDAFRAIQYNDADICVAGGAESAITPVGVAGFSALTALSESEDPLRASIPFDKDRNGFVMGEGAGILVLEELEHAKQRGAKIYAEVVGYGATCDAYHITSPLEDGSGAARAMELAMEEAGVKPEEVTYINAHGTSTHHNDLFETRAIRKAFGDAADHVLVNSTKSMVGHLLGAAGGVEAVVCAKSIQDGFVHQTIGTKEADAECDLNYCIGAPVETDVKLAMSNSLGFGGHNAVLLFQKYE